VTTSQLSFRAAARASAARTRDLVMPERVPPRPPADGGLRVAFVMYRGNPRVGGQGVYARHVTRELVALGHSVEVFSGQPWPLLDEGVGFTPVPGLDLYREPDPFRTPMPRELRTRANLLEWLTTLSGGFAEPWAFGIRVKQLLRARRNEFDFLHDNQTLATGILDLYYDGWPTLEALHHPITVDRSIAIAHAPTAAKRRSLRRWYGFLRMQTRVAQQLPAIVTVSHNSRADIAAQMGVDPSRITVVPVGVDHEVFKPHPDVAPVPGRLMVTTSSDVPMKGLLPLLEAIATLREHRHIEVTVIGRPNPDGPVAAAISRLGLSDAVTTIAGVSDEDLARLYAEAQVAVVPSLYEGFSLPAIEAMACAVPVVATTGGALPEVVGSSGATGILVEPNNPGALAAAIAELLDDPARRAALGAAGRERVMRHFTWQVTARGTAACFDAVLRKAPLPEPVPFD
jgi:glycosyltransferase involved in cell wall biosynthesis